MSSWPIHLGRPCGIFWLPNETDIGVSFLLKASTIKLAMRDVHQNHGAGANRSKTSAPIIDQAGRVQSHREAAENRTIHQRCIRELRTSKKIYAFFSGVNLIHQNI